MTTVAAIPARPPLPAALPAGGSTATSPPLALPGEHFAVALRDEHYDLRLSELAAEERGVRALGLRHGRDESIRVEVVVRPDENRAESAEGREVGRRCGTDGGRWSIGWSHACGCLTRYSLLLS